MNDRMNVFLRTVAVVFGMLLCFVVASPAQVAQSDESLGIAHPNSPYEGFTYPEWSFLQWQMIYSTDPLPQPQVLHFLPSVQLDFTHPVTMADTVPAGKATFVMVVGFTDIFQYLKDDVASLEYMARTNMIACTIDGVQLKHLEKYVSAVPFAHPDPNLGDTDITAGIYLIINLKSGSHAIILDYNFGPGYVAQINYQLTVLGE